MKWPLFVLLLINSMNSSFAEEKNPCFKAIQKHITEAIAYNKKMLPRYAELSSGKSILLSATLINLEKAARLLVRKIDRESRIYQENGIPLLCEEIPDMKALPVFQERLASELRPVHLHPYDYKILSRLLKKLLNENQLEEAYQAIAVDLHKLQEEPNQRCLTRHFLESMALTLKLSEKHRAAAREAGLPDPIDTIKKFVTTHRQNLILTNFLDTRAFPLQKDGLLIYCQDVPPIKWE